MTKKVLLYLRNSADTLRTTCADSQRHFAETFIRKNGWKLELPCRDEDIGEVAFTAQPGVHKLLNEIEFGSSDIVLCHKLGSGLIAHSQKITVAARAMAERKAIGHRS